MSDRDARRYADWLGDNLSAGMITLREYDAEMLALKKREHLTCCNLEAARWADADGA